MIILFIPIELLLLFDSQGKSFFPLAVVYILQEVCYNTIMNWASSAIDLLASGINAEIRPIGGSMRGLVESGDLVLLSPCDASSLSIGDIVLCRVGVKVYLHLVKGVSDSGILIGNNLGKINGYASEIYGRVIMVNRCKI